ncbi:MAG: hypothetical protein J3R72DRAFT_435836 [Linnemannia gamsii]|nr:MAG: hypothetical protein J3R72DRAFT_435836 [Linnemannia gamsii]
MNTTLLTFLVSSRLFFHFNLTSFTLPYNKHSHLFQLQSLSPHKNNYFSPPSSYDSWSQSSHLHQTRLPALHPHEHLFKA